MDGSSSGKPTIQWFWIIEYLSSFQQVPVGLLHDILKEAPPLTDDLRSKVDEVVALRILEEICTVGDDPSSSTSSADLGKKVGFDLSHTCHDVLECITKEASISDIMARRKPLQRDIRPFVLHKRASMPKAALQQMFSGKQPIKDHRGLSVAAGEDTVATNNHDGVGIQHPNTNAKRIPTFASLLNNDLKGGSNKRVSLPSDMGMSPNAKKLKEAVPNPLETEKSVLPDGALGAEGVVESVEGDGCNLSNYQMGTSAAVDEGTESSALPRRIIDGSGNEASPGVANDSDTLNNGNSTLNNGSRLLEGDSIVGSYLPMKRQLGDNLYECSENLAENLYECQQTRDDPDLVPDATKLKRSPLGDASEPKEDTIECNTEFDLDMDVEQLKEKEPSICGDVDQDLEIDIIIMKKIKFLRLKEQNVCVKCKEGGQLLVCRIKTCPFAVHEKCVGGFDEGGDFHCFFCSFSDAVKEYRKFEKEASSLREDLATFICTCFEVDPEGGVLEDEVTDPEGTGLGQDHEKGGKSHVDNKTQQIICVKCKQGGGEFLVCWGENCSLAVHEKCLGFSAGAGNFYCPFCSYSDAVKEYREFEKAASSLRGDVAPFINCGFGVDLDIICGEARNLSGNEGGDPKGDKEVQLETPEQNPDVEVSDGASEGHVISFGEAANLGGEEKKGDENINVEFSNQENNEAPPAINALTDDVDKTSDSEGSSEDQLPEEASLETPHASRQTEEEEVKTPKDGGSSADVKSTPWRKRLIEFGTSLLMAGRGRSDSKNK